MSSWRKCARGLKEAILSERYKKPSRWAPSIDNVVGDEQCANSGIH
jgi:hypothetical protein